jgi:uncharacterized membrane protein
VLRYLTAYLAIAIVMVVLDMLWLGVIAKPLYQQGIGHLMAAKPKFMAAVMFYAIFPIGVMMFAVVPCADDATWGKTLLTGALFGFFAYATYGLSNLALLKEWPVSVSIIDTVWGTVVTAVGAGIGKAALDGFGPA